MTTVRLHLPDGPSQTCVVDSYAELCARAAEASNSPPESITLLAGHPPTKVDDPLTLPDRSAVTVHVVTPAIKAEQVRASPFAAAVVAAHGSPPATITATKAQSSSKGKGKLPAGAKIISLDSDDDEPPPPPPPKRPAATVNPVISLDSDDDDEPPSKRQARPRPPAPLQQISIFSNGRVSFAWGPVLKSDIAGSAKPNHGNHPYAWSNSQIISKAADSSGSTYLWAIAGVVKLRPIAGGQYLLTAAGDKTQIGAFGTGVFKPPGTGLIQKRKAGLLAAWSRGEDVDASLNPLGGKGNGVSNGYHHKWRYGNESSAVPPFVCEDCNVELANFMWSETKVEAHYDKDGVAGGSWKWKWQADWLPPIPDNGASAGIYLLVADQRAKSITQSPKRYLTKMVGTLVKLPNSKALRHLAVDDPQCIAAAREVLESLGTNPSGGGDDSATYAGGVEPCWATPTREAAASDKCFKCKMLGHFARNCPNSKP